MSIATFYSKTQHTHTQNLVIKMSNGITGTSPPETRQNFRHPRDQPPKLRPFSLSILEQIANLIKHGSQTHSRSTVLRKYTPFRSKDSFHSILFSKFQTNKIWILETDNWHSWDKIQWQNQQKSASLSPFFFLSVLFSISSSLESTLLDLFLKSNLR